MSRSRPYSSGVIGPSHTRGPLLIASTLEKRWNDAMQRLLELEAELANFERQTLRTITAEQKRQILQLASDFPRLWTAPTTAARR